MRLKDPFSLKTADMTKRSNKPKKPCDEDSSDEVGGLTCQHVSRAVDLSSVKKAVTGSLWSVCCECIKERKMFEGESEEAHDIFVCLKCGFQGCNLAETQHSTKHQQAHHSDSHCITISLSTWKAWCFECKEELSTHCNKKSLAKTLDFLQKHSAKATSGTTSKIIKLREEPSENVDSQRGKCPANSTLIPVKGIINLGNTCFFNAVMQNLSQTHMLNELIQEVKEKGHKMKICPTTETNLGPLTVTLPRPEPLTSAMFLFLQSMKEPSKGPVSPKILFSQLCQKAPRFKGYQQQDSQELLHYLLDAMRVEETKRIKAGILKAFNNPTEKTADEETKRQVKAYGKEGVKMNFVDRIFVGELNSTIMCEECEHISTVKEAFIDISLPIIEERPTNPGRLGKSGREQDTLVPHSEDSSAAHSQVNKNRRMSGQKMQDRHSSTSHDDRGADSVSIGQEEELCVAGRSLTSYRADKMGSQSDYSKKDSNLQDSSNDADSEASESEWSPRVPSVPSSHSNISDNVLTAMATLTTSHHPKHNLNPSSSPTPLPSFRPQQGSAVEHLVSVVSMLGLVHTSTDTLPISLSPDEQTETRERDRDRKHHHQRAFQALCHSYMPSSKECSVQSCLHQFTSVELLMGNNKLLCENCTERKQRQMKWSGGADKKAEKVYTSARKQMLISSLPPVVTLHLKRFHQAGMNLRKVNRHVDFPLTLDLAPFCSATCKNLGSEERVLYSLYGIVEHSGSMRGGHYTAYVKVRSPQREQCRNQSGSREASSAQQGQWVYVSDTNVQTVPEFRVLNSQAYLLFYEELL
ncbi:ubiquitin carboxyl-terminal hydrolase 45-like [Xyrauchen texanus]|uniref:ubiquitin carboxyl-terminal hydrolase 45-like n=1 Tax=Xyrauchen texanus TaxID=154827 RepID=UPI00224271CD|nr:ubiquitin carboxyl-terminal hydrolase 45-like [Xyrauchen texanus]XP_051999896.1 ubiquitin carboxyl-terminal hydrolase 45-like [Xyrauchen texanus]XP_051999897.1 ubiquitin carboxyl-terminal hydrolase 45-like [Xyrauchen texanus]